MSMLIPFTPHDWFWEAADGRVFASAREIVTDRDDAAFRAAPERVTPWPRSDSGAQTKAALQAVLTPFSITAP